MALAAGVTAIKWAPAPKGVASLGGELESKNFSGPTPK